MTEQREGEAGMKTAVVGAGLMGSGIALTCALAGYEVKNIDVCEPAIKRAADMAERLLAKKAAKGKMTEEEKREILGRLTYSSRMEEVKDADIIVEAVPEQIELKKSVFQQIDQLAAPETIIVSNTSGLSISEIAAATKRPNQVMGIHFFYPAPVMKLAELIRGLATNDDTYHKVRTFAVSLNKTVVDAPEYPGFIVNRILVPMQNEAAFMVMEGCRPEAVDTAMKLGCNFPMGPLELTDFVGVDVMLATMTGLYQGFHDSKYRPCPLLETMVKAGRLGRKSGWGFYKYNESGKRG